MTAPGQEEVEDGLLGGQPPRGELHEQLGGGGGVCAARGGRERWHCFGEGWGGVVVTRVGLSSAVASRSLFTRYGKGIRYV